MVQNASCQSIQDLLIPTLTGRRINTKVKGYLVTELSELLLNKLTKDRRLEIAEFINTHPEEFEKVLNQAFSENAELKKPLLDIVDLLNGTQMVLVIEKAVLDDDALIRKQGLQAAYRTRVDSLNVQVAEILSNREELFEVRKWALHILGSSDPEYYSSQIIKITRNSLEDVNIRKEAIFALTQIVNDKTLGTLCILLGDTDDEIRQSGAWALSNIGSSDSINCLLAALNDENEIVRDWAIRGLRDMDDARALQGLAEAIHTSPPKEQVRMTRLVIERKSEVILRAIVELLSSEDTHVRCTAAWAPNRRARRAACAAPAGPPPAPCAWPCAPARPGRRRSPPKGASRGRASRRSRRRRASERGRPRCRSPRSPGRHRAIRRAWCRRPPSRPSAWSSALSAVP